MAEGRAGAVGEREAEESRTGSNKEEKEEPVV